MSSDAHPNSRESASTSQDDSQQRVNRRRFLGTATSGTVVALAGCSSLANSSESNTKASEGTVTGTGGENLNFNGDKLRVMVWSGPYGDRFEKVIKPLYEEKTGASLQISRGWSEIIAKIRAAPKDKPPFDIAITEGQFYHMGRQSSLFEPIRRENIPNLDNVIDHYREFRTTKYGVPVDGAPCNIIYRKDKDFTPKTYADLATEPVKNSKGIAIDSGFWVFPMHCAAVGMDQKELAGEIYEKNMHQSVLDYLNAWKISGWATSGEDIWQWFENGIIDYAQFYYVQAKSSLDEFDYLEQVTPERNAGFIDHYCVVRGTNKRRMGEHFLNFLLDAETQTEWSKVAPNLFTNKDMKYASKDLKEALPNNSEEAKNIAWPNWSYLTQYQDKFSSEFDKMQTKE